MPKSAASTKIGKANRVYSFKHTALLHETNAAGGVVYFSNFVKWQGMARESVLRERTNYKQLMSSSVEMITHSCSVEFLGHLYFGDVVRIEVSTSNIMPSSFVILFRYFNDTTDELVATGKQKITFAVKRSRQVCRIPTEILGVVKTFEVQSKEAVSH